jgi:hypothetical protein
MESALPVWLRVLASCWFQNVKKGRILPDKKACNPDAMPPQYLYHLSTILR